MIRLLPLIFLSLVTNAEPIVSMDSVLMYSLDARVREFQRLGNKGAVFLSRVAQDPKESLQTRWRAITTMGKLDPLKFRLDLEHALISRDWFARNAALIAIRSADRSFVVNSSTRALKDPALVVRTQAVRNLIDIEAKETEPILWKLLYDRKNFRSRESLWIRSYLAEGVAKFASPGRVENFKKLLMDRDARVHKWAIIGLESLTGLKLSDKKEPVEIRRRKWLARLDLDESI